MNLSILNPTWVWVVCQPIVLLMAWVVVERLHGIFEDTDGIPLLPILIVYLLGILFPNGWVIISMFYMLIVMGVAVYVFSSINISRQTGEITWKRKLSASKVATFLLPSIVFIIYRKCRGVKNYE